MAARCTTSTRAAGLGKKNLGVRRRADHGCGRSRRATHGVSGQTLYYMVERPLSTGAGVRDPVGRHPKQAVALLARIPSPRVASWHRSIFRSHPDGQGLALPLTDGFTTNIWALSTANGEWRSSHRFRLPRRVFHRPPGVPLSPMALHLRLDRRGRCRRLILLAGYRSALTPRRRAATYYRRPDVPATLPGEGGGR